MSEGLYNTLHSHSGIERDEHFPKTFVLVDERWGELFKSKGVEPILYPYNGITYLKVPIRTFVSLGGIFKNLSK